MARITIDNARCDRSPGCPSAHVCPRRAIEPVPGGTYPGANGYTINESLCTGCGICARVCAGGAVQIG